MVSWRSWLARLLHSKRGVKAEEVAGSSPAETILLALLGTKIFWQLSTMVLLEHVFPEWPSREKVGSVWSGTANEHAPAQYEPKCGVECWSFSTRERVQSGSGRGLSSVGRGPCISDHWLSGVGLPASNQTTITPAQRKASQNAMASIPAAVTRLLSARYPTLQLDPNWL